MGASEIYDVEQITFSAIDGYQLTGRLYQQSDQVDAVLLINSGTGIPQKFYTHFAKFAANQGFAVLTYDYRGIGESAPRSLKDSNATYREWGQLDVTAAIKWLKQRFPQHPLTVLGHSTGGQQLGLAENVSDVSAALFVSVSTGYWKGMFPKTKWLSLWLWTCYVPLMTRLLGYSPSKAIGMGENLPSGVAREWGSWCLEPEYLAAFFDDTGHRKPVNNKPFGETRFSQAEFPIKAFCFTDDDIATTENVPPLMRLFSNAQQEINWISPEMLKVTSIGHFGFFRPNVGQQLWSDALQWLKSKAQAT